MSDLAAQLEAQLRHLTLPTQRGYRRIIEKKLAEIERPAAPPVALSDSDQAIVEALRHIDPRYPGKNGKPIPPWLYAAVNKWDSKKADLDRWFVTGPRDRRGYIRGPFSRAQIERIAATGLLTSVCCENGRPVCYELKRGRVA